MTSLRSDGLRVELLAQKHLSAKLVYVTPSHQFPLGVVLSLANRLQPLDLAAQNDAWIIEDDFDSEYRYKSKPIPALQGLDRNGRVIYIGTFSKVLFPSLRFGYLIVPEDFVDTFLAARWVSDRCSPLIEQAALADFIAEGHLARTRAPNPSSCVSCSSDGETLPGGRDWSRPAGLGSWLGCRRCCDVGGPASWSVRRS